jgi:hypothetical protein
VAVAQRWAELDSPRQPLAVLWLSAVFWPEASGLVAAEPFGFAGSYSCPLDPEESFLAAKKLLARFGPLQARSSVSDLLRWVLNTHRRKVNQ